MENLSNVTTGETPSACGGIVRLAVSSALSFCKLSLTKKSDILPEFQNFLLEKKLVPEKNVFFYALWAGKFFTYARKKQINSDEYQENAVIEFIESLKSDPNMSDWKIRQAHDAIRLYYFHYRGLKPKNPLA